MKAGNIHWKERLDGSIQKALSIEIDEFETMLELRKKGKVEEKLFAETRLRRGAYGQRYDNGTRHDGIQTQTLDFPSSETKGTNTCWDAPGMLRIKIPFGGLTTQQCETLADLAEEYSDGIAHVTTRQDFQLHFIHIDDNPSIMRRLASVGITTREACGNSVRNVTSCPLAGCCQDEVFDVTPYAKALAYFLLGHHDVQDFGRKFKIAFSGCKEHSCGLANMHDLGFIAKTKVLDGKEKRGFSFYVGGGLGAVPHEAHLLEEFVSEEELLPLSQAIGRVFANLGEKKNRARARIKFLIAKLGLEEFRKLVQEERQKQPYDPRWTAYLEDLPSYYQESALKPPGISSGNFPESSDSSDVSSLPSSYQEWLRTNVYQQRQKGYSIVTIKLPLGDITGTQLRMLADISRKYVQDTLRTTVDQNIAIRWVSNTDLPSLYKDLEEAELAERGAGGITDIVACPGTDTCKLGISASRGLAGELRRRFFSGDIEVDDVIQNLHIKISGCFNSCGQHHISDLGFYGVSRKSGSHKVPHFQVVLGGQWEENGGSYGLPVLAVPSKNIPEVVQRLVKSYTQGRKPQESFLHFIKRLGRTEAKKILVDLAQLPSYENDSSFYRDWGDPREYTTGDMGIGECAGEVIDRIQMDLAASERLLFEAQLLLEKGEYEDAVHKSFHSMKDAARALVKTSYLDVASEPEVVIPEFRKRLYDTKIFFDPYAGGKFAAYLFAAYDMIQAPPERAFSGENARLRVEEAGLFIEACHSCHLRISSQSTSISA